MPTALSKESSLLKKKVTVTPLIGGRRDSQLSNKTNSRTAERRSTSPQVITAFFPSGQRVRIRFRANLTWSYLPTSNKSSHSRLTKHSFGVDKGEGVLSYIMLWWIGWLHSLWGKKSSFWFNCKKTTLEFYMNTKPNKTVYLYGFLKNEKIDYHNIWQKHHSVCWMPFFLARSDQE